MKPLPRLTIIRHLPYRRHWMDHPTKDPVAVAAWVFWLAYAAGFLVLTAYALMR